MNCKYCHAAIPSTRGICPKCGRMASKEQMAMLKDFNKNSGWDNYSNKQTQFYKNETAHEPRNLLRILFIPLVILILIVIALIKILIG